MDSFHFTFEQEGKIPKEWQIWTWSDYWNDCRKFAKALVSLGVDKFGVVNIMGFNSVTFQVLFSCAEELHKLLCLTL
jgi:long-subunit acyl-CoA synthetase (AMP-forming)